MHDLISVGSISIDFYFRGDSLTYKENRFQLAIGGKYSVDNFYTGLGGGGANVAIGIKKHGWETAILGTIGNNIFKQFIINRLDQFKINHRLCDIVDNYFNLSTILLTKKGERTILHYVSPHQKLFDHHISINQLINTKVLYLGNLPDIALDERISLLSFAKQHKIMTVLNLGIKDCRRPKNQIKNLLEKTDILILNGHEFAELVKAAYKDIHFHDDVVKWYIPYLSNRTVIITESSKGSYGYFQNKVYFQKVIKTDQIIDTTGAGDGYTAGFIAEYLKSKDIEKAMLSGSKYAVKILSKIGAN